MKNELLNYLYGNLNNYFFYFNQPN